MSPHARSALTFLGVGVAIALFFVVRWVFLEGVFNQFAPVSPGVCRVLARIAGPEAFAIDAAQKGMFVSSTDRHAAHPSARDGLYWVGLTDPAVAPVKLSGTPPDFHPQGISLYRGPGGEVLFAINHHAGGSYSIDTFNVGFSKNVPFLTAQSSIAGGLLVSPHGVAAISSGQFYLTNDHVTHTALGRFAEDDLLWPHADLLFFNGTGFRIAVQRMTFPSGVLVAPDGSHLYVAAANERRLIAFSRSIFSGELAEIGSLSIPAQLDNVSMDAHGDLIIAGHPSLPKLHGFQADAGKPSPSVVFRVHLGPDGAPTDYQTIYANDGGEIGASSSAVIEGGHLYIGSVLDDKMLDCRERQPGKV